MRTSTFTTMVIDSLLAGRSSIAGGPGNEIGTLHKGVSTRNDVVTAFGDPEEATREGNRQVCVWSRLSAMTPSPRLIVYFDEDDVVVDYRIAS